HALAIEELLQLALLEHLTHDIATADELALDVELGNGRPIGEALDALANTHIVEDVNVAVADAEMAEDLRHLRGEAALRKILGALHKHDDVVVGDRLADPVVDGLLAHAQSSIALSSPVLACVPSGRPSGAP